MHDTKQKEVKVCGRFACMCTRVLSDIKASILMVQASQLNADSNIIARTRNEKRSGRIMHVCVYICVFICRVGPNRIWDFRLRIYTPINRIYTYIPYTVYIPYI